MIAPVPCRKGEVERDKEPKLTELLHHLVALVQNEMLDLGGIQLLVLDQLSHSTRRSNHNMRTGFLLVQLLLVCRDGRSTVEDLCSDVCHEF